MHLKQILRVISRAAVTLAPLLPPQLLLTNDIRGSESRKVEFSRSAALGVAGAGMTSDLRGKIQLWQEFAKQVRCEAGVREEEIG